MKRFMIDPLHFGTQSGLPYIEDASGQMINQPHADYTTLYTLDWSVRVWEPARWGLHEDAGAGELQMEAGYNAQTPSDAQGQLLAIPEAMPVQIHGIKGDLWLAMGHESFQAGSGQPNPLGEWTSVDTGDVLAVDDTDAWAALGGFANRSERLHCPMFICLYRGTYKQIDDLAGWEIDSGPADDPDTLLGLDISSPSVLESTRLDWWMRVDLPFPAVFASEVPAETGVDPARATQARNLRTRVPMDLSANKRLAANQVMWLHCRTGVIRTMVRAGPAGSKTMVDALYRNHSFHAWSCMSALVSVGRQR